MKIAALILCSSAAFGSVGFQQLTIDDAGGKPLAVAIWYPSDAPPSAQALELYTQTVAKGGAISGRRLPLVVISHGNQGSLSSHFDTAIALAEAGFVAAAVMHTGDNWQDQAYVRNGMNLPDRPRQMRRVVDFLLKEWAAHDRIDATRIGVFGHSLGGFTALVMIGGVPDPSAIPRLCARQPDAPECAFVKQNMGDPSSAAVAAPAQWLADARIRAAVIAAPAVGIDFENGGLRAVKVPVQLWRAEDDQLAPDGWNSKIVREGLPMKPEEHVVKNASHMAFRPCSEAMAKAAPFVCQDPAGFDRAKFHQEFNRAVVEFFRTKLSAR